MPAPLCLVTPCIAEAWEINFVISVSFSASPPLRHFSVVTSSHRSIASIGLYLWFLGRIIERIITFHARKERERSRFVSSISIYDRSFNRASHDGIFLAESIGAGRYFTSVKYFAITLTSGSNPWKKEKRIKFLILWFITLSLPKLGHQ